MRIINRQPKETADISAEKDSTFLELRNLLFLAVITLAIIYFGVGALVDFGVRHISYQQEVNLFGLFSKSDDFFAEDSSVDDEIISRLQSVLETLSQHPDVPDIEFTLSVIKDEDPNAFAFPGGTIGVTTGLLELVTGEIELAFVLGHELGHFRNRDHLTGFGRALGIGICYSLIFGRQLDSGGVTRVMLSVLEGGHSRQQESKADQFGLKLVFDQYGTTEGFDRLFQFLKKQHDIPRWTRMFATHPAPEDRIDTLIKYAQELEDL